MTRWGWVVLLVGWGHALYAQGPAWPEETDEMEPPAMSTAPVPAEPVPEPVRPPLKIVHPPEGMVIPAVKSSFVYGWAIPDGELTVNGQKVKIHSGGGWLAVVPYTPGPFTIQAELRSPTTSYVAFRRVVVGGGGGGGVPGFGVSAIQPDQDMVLKEREMVTVQAQSAPGLDVSFQVGDDKKRWPMTDRGGGLYRSLYVLPAAGVLENEPVKISVWDKKKNRRASAVALGRVSRLDEDRPWVVEVSTDLAILRTGPGPRKDEKAGYALFPAVGTRLWVTGRRGKELRVQLSHTREAWIGEDEVRDLPLGTPPPRTTVSAVSIETLGRHTLVRVALGQKVPFEVRPIDDTAMDVLFFGASSNTDWMHYRAPDGAVRRVEWYQDDTTTFRLRLYLRPGRWWGYDARYDNGAFLFELRRPPPNPRSPSSLEGLHVVVDPGHSPDRGAVGPTEFLEKDANLAIAKCLEKKLLAERARVTMVRNGSENVGLYDRPKVAWNAGGDVLISVHNNALPEGGNPFVRNGYSVYYYHPQSFELARLVHQSYTDRFQRPNARVRLNDDGLHYGNLALPRTMQMPSVLTESAYMIVPEEEALLKTESFQCECAEAMVRGLRRYLEGVRRKDVP